MELGNHPLVFFAINMLLPFATSLYVMNSYVFGISDGIADSILWTTRYLVYLSITLPMSSIFFHPIISLKNLQKRYPSGVLVKYYAILCLVGHSIMVRSPLLNLYFTKKYPMLMCCEFTVQVFLPFFSIHMDLVLSLCSL